MNRQLSCLTILMLAWAGAGCTEKSGATARSSRRNDLSAEQRDAEKLGREIFDLVDRAMDYKGSHEGRPANNLTLMGVESLTPVVVRRVVNVERQPLVTVAFRNPSSHKIVSCFGDNSIIEDAFVNGGQFTITCSTSSGAQRRMEVGGTPER